MDIHSLEKKKVIEFPTQVDINPLVSVIVLAHNHESYIKQCLDGILSQQTDFNYEIIVGEDESSDGTRLICEAYAVKYPQKIRLFLHHRENNIAINGRPTGRFNFLYNLQAARGKYIALCDGDDYWIDNSKLQKQAEYLERNHDCAGVFSDALVKTFDKSELFSSNYEILKTQNRFNFDHILQFGWIIPSASLFFKKIRASDFDAFINEITSPDYLLHLEIASRGEIYFISESLVVYRKEKQGITQGYSSDKLARLKFYLSEIKLKETILERYQLTEEQLTAVTFQLNFIRLRILFNNLKRMKIIKAFHLPKYHDQIRHLLKKDKLIKFFLNS